MRNALLIPLDKAAQAGLDLVGGKALNLGRLIQAGFPVPDGFVLTTRCYQAFVSANDLAPLIARRDEHGIRLAFEAAGMPPQLDCIVRQAWQKLEGARTVAVRSSATAEDLNGVSFAGGQATTLNVATLDDLMLAVRRSWASLWTERVMAYRSRMGIDESRIALAVVVQEMVSAEVSGVAFTLDPVTGDNTNVVINAVPGLGEALVSGQVTPDQIRVRRDKPRVERDRNACLTASRAREVARIALRIEDALGGPQDVEWSFDARGSLRILQARPVTAIGEQAVRWESPVPGAVFVRRGCGGLVEYLPKPVSPLFATAQIPGIMELHDAQCPEMGVLTPTPTSTFIRGYFYSRADYRLTWKAAKLPFGYIRAAWGAADRWRHRVLPRQQARLSQLSAVDPATLTDPELMNHLHAIFSHNARVWDDAVRATRAYVTPEPVFGMVYRRLVQPVAPGDPIALLRGFDSQVMVAERVQWLLVRDALRTPGIEKLLRSHPAQQAIEELDRLAAAAGWMRRFRSWCRDFGHLATNLDFAEPAPVDDPARALTAIQIRLDLVGPDPFERLARLSQQREAAMAQTLQKLAGRPLRRRAFTAACRWAQKGAAIREDIFFYAMRGFPVARRAALELGRRWVVAKRIQRQDDIFWLQWNEIETISSHAGELVAERKREAQAGAAMVPPPEVPLGGSPPTWKRKAILLVKRWVTGARTESDDGVLHGSPVSSGIVTGPARILHSTSDFKRLQAGDILVTRAATPDWTPAFSLAAGVVTDTGGPLSHSSIIAREYSIPAVMGVAVATRRIAEGQIVTVDGSAGLIRLHTGGETG